MILVKIEALKGIGDCKIPKYGTEDSSDWFVADSFTFGVEREMKESGEKGGTEDMNIGIGELQECNISKSQDRGSTILAQHAINGNSLGPAEIHFIETAGENNEAFCYLKYILARCWVKSWSTSGDADDRPTEEVAFYYNKIAFNYAYTKNGKVFSAATPMAWDNVKNQKWADSLGNVTSLDQKAGFAIGAPPA